MNKNVDGSDLVGQTFNNLTIVAVASKGPTGFSFKTICACGNECIVERHKLLSGQKKSCGCLKLEHKIPSPSKDLTGKQFGELRVLELHPERRLLKHSRVRQWICECSCGKQVNVTGSNLNSGVTKSCGHLKHKGYNKKPGEYRSKVYAAWAKAVDRCYNDKYPSTAKYKGRGIIVEDYFLNSFENFYSYIGDPPSAEYTLERIDVNGNYERGNIRWETKEKQARNKTKLRNNTTGVTGVTFNETSGRTRVIASWREFCTNSGKTILRNKSFSVGKFGLLEAFSKACAFRESKIEELNSLGYGYSDKHGK